MNQRSFSIKESIKWSASATWRNFGLLFFVLLLPIVFQVGLSALTRFYAQQRFLFFVVILGILGGLLSVVFYLGQLQIGLDIYKHGSSTLRRILIPLKVIIFYILAGSLLSLIVLGVVLGMGLVSLLPIGLASYFDSAILLILSLVILVPICVVLIGNVFLAYNFFDVALVDTGCGPIEALRESAKLTRGVRLRLLGFYLAISGVIILSVVTIIGLLFTIPMATLARVYLYRKLKEARG